MTDICLLTFSNSVISTDVVCAELHAYGAFTRLLTALILCVCVSVWVCEWEREREREWVCVWESERVCEWESVCVRVCVCESVCVGPFCPQPVEHTCLSSFERNDSIKQQWRWLTVMERSGWSSRCVLCAVGCSHRLNVFYLLSVLCTFTLFVLFAVSCGFYITDVHSEFTYACCGAVGSGVDICLQRCLSVMILFGAGLGKIKWRI